MKAARIFEKADWRENMPICQKCHQQWGWMQTIRKMFTLDTSMICPHCGKKQYLTIRSKKKSNLLVFIIPFIMLLGVLFSVPPLITLIGIVLSSVAVIGIYPLFFELANEEEALW